jgi:hypothetical protein
MEYILMMMVHPDRGGLRDGDHAEHRDPGADPLKPLATTSA